LRRLLVSVTLLAVLAAPAAALGAKATAPKAPVAGPNLPDAKAWILVDARDGTVLAAKGPDRELPIASTTKLMTAYLALQRLKPSQKLTVPKYDAGGAESLLGLHVGERMSVRDLLYALVLDSANDAAETFAVGVSGSVKAFVGDMNDTAAALGLTQTHYSTPVGLDTPGNYSSPRDLVTLAGRLRQNPLFARVSDSTSATLKTGDEPRHIVTRVTLLDSYPFVTGVKTGHTLDAGYVLVGSGEKRGTTLISAVLGTPSEGARDADTLKLLRYGFSQYKPSTPVKAGSTLAGPELDYGRGKLELEANRSIEVTTRPGQKVETAVQIPATLEGGVEKGQPIGVERVTVDGHPAGASPLVAAESVGAAGIFRKAFSALSSPLILLPLGLIVIVAGVMLASGRRPHLPSIPRRADPGPDPDTGTGGAGAAVREPDGPGGDVPPDPGSERNGDEPRPKRGRRREKSQRTPEDRERMRKERMERRSRNRAPGGDK
jgi:D-alanyl-D-alanine carboxypeptidase (penicillin-binding protein 5/6)